MSDYENDPRVTKVSDDEYHIDIADQGVWRVFRSGSWWFSEAPPAPPFTPHGQTFEHPSKETAFESIVGDRTTVVMPTE